MTPAGRKAFSSKASRRNYLDRETISPFVQCGNLYSQPFAVPKHEDTECARICFIKPLRSIVLPCLIEREVTSCEFLAQHLLGFISEATARRKLQEFFVAQGPVVFVERVFVRHGVDPIIEPANFLPGTSLF
jgi:hypothetical protein